MGPVLDMTVSPDGQRLYTAECGECHRADGKRDDHLDEGECVLLTKPRAPHLNRSFNDPHLVFRAPLGNIGLSEGSLDAPYPRLWREKLKAAGSPPPSEPDRCYFQPVVASFEKPVGAAESSAGHVAFLPYHVPACVPAVMSTR